VRFQWVTRVEAAKSCFSKFFASQRLEQQPARRGEGVVIVQRHKKNGNTNLGFSKEKSTLFAGESGEGIMGR
jgi:hypothetical protein